MANDRLRVSESTAASAATAADTGVTSNVVAEADENEVDDVALYHDSDDGVDDDSVDDNDDMPCCAKLCHAMLSMLSYAKLCSSAVAAADVYMIPRSITCIAFPLTLSSSRLQPPSHRIKPACPLLANYMAPKEATTEGRAAQPAGASSSAAQPASFPVRELNKRSGQFGAWSVVVQQAQVLEERS